MGGRSPLTVFDYKSRMMYACAAAVGSLDLIECTNEISLFLLSLANKLLSSFSQIMKKTLQIEHLLLIKPMQRYFNTYSLIKLKLCFSPLLVSQTIVIKIYFFFDVAVVKNQGMGGGGRTVGDGPGSIKDFFYICSLIHTIHLGLIFKMGDHLFEITQLGLNASKTSTSRRSSLPAL